jgi:hypothetical protein
MAERGAVRLLYRWDQDVPLSPTRLNSVEDLADTAMNLFVDLVSILCAERADGRYVDRLPIVAWLGIEPVSKAFEHAFAHIRRYSGRLAFLRRRIGAKEVAIAKLLHGGRL